MPGIHATLGPRTARCELVRYFSVFIDPGVAPCVRPALEPTDSGAWIPDLCFLLYFGILGIGDKNIKNIIVNLNVILKRFIVCAKG